MALRCYIAGRLEVFVGFYLNSLNSLLCHNHLIEETHSLHYIPLRVTWWVPLMPLEPLTPLNNNPPHPFDIEQDISIRRNKKPERVALAYFPLGLCLRCAEKSACKSVIILPPRTPHPQAAAALLLHSAGHLRWGCPAPAVEPAAVHRYPEKQPAMLR